MMKKTNGCTVVPIRAFPWIAPRFTRRDSLRRKEGCQGRLERYRVTTHGVAGITVVRTRAVKTHVVR